MTKYLDVELKNVLTDDYRRIIVEDNVFREMQMQFAEYELVSENDVGHPLMALDAGQKRIESLHTIGYITVAAPGADDSVPEFGLDKALNEILQAFHDNYPDSELVKIEECTFRGVPRCIEYVSKFGTNPDMVPLIDLAKAIDKFIMEEDRDTCIQHSKSPYVRDLAEWLKHVWDQWFIEPTRPFTTSATIVAPPADMIMLTKHDIITDHYLAMQTIEQALPGDILITTNGLDSGTVRWWLSEKRTWHPLGEVNLEEVTWGKSVEHVYTPQLDTWIDEIGETASEDSTSDEEETVTDTVSGAIFRKKKKKEITKMRNPFEDEIEWMAEEEEKKHIEQKHTIFTLKEREPKGIKGFFKRMFSSSPE